MNHIDLNQYKRDLGGRIKRARLESGYKTRAELTAHFSDWSEGRLANYESGMSLPGPIDILRIADKTGVNPCWITFGTGSMKSVNLDISAIRRQNFLRVCAELDSKQLQDLQRKLKIKKREFQNYINNGTTRITKSLCRKIERALDLEKDSLDVPVAVDAAQMIGLSPEQHELASIYDSLDQTQRKLLLEIARTIKGVSID